MVVGVVFLAFLCQTTFCLRFILLTAHTTATFAGLLLDFLPLGSVLMLLLFSLPIQEFLAQVLWLVTKVRVP